MEKSSFLFETTIDSQERELKERGNEVRRIERSA